MSFPISIRHATITNRIVVSTFEFQNSIIAYMSLNACCATSCNSDCEAHQHVYYHKINLYTTEIESNIITRLLTIQKFETNATGIPWIIHRFNQGWNHEEGSWDNGTIIYYNANRFDILKQCIVDKLVMNKSWIVCPDCELQYNLYKISFADIKFSAPHIGLCIKHQQQHQVKLVQYYDWLVERQRKAMIKRRSLCNVKAKQMNIRSRPVMKKCTTPVHAQQIVYNAINCKMETNKVK